MQVKIDDEVVIWITREWHITFINKTTFLGHYPCMGIFEDKAGKTLLQGYAIEDKYSPCGHKVPLKVFRAYAFYKFMRE